MVKQNNESMTVDFSKAVHETERVNLYNFGYEKSGTVKGDPEIYISFLNRIVNGDLVEENYKGVSDDEKKERREKITLLEKELEEVGVSNKKFEEEIKAKEKKADDYKQDLLQLRESHNENPEKIKSESFSPFKFSINLFILIMLSIYLFFFYVSATYKALYIDFEKVADNIAQGIGTGSVMPGPYELAEALQYNYLLFLVPFVFFAFGWAFHIILELKHKVKFVFIGLLVTLTFIVDFLLAMLIHNNTEAAKELMGLQTAEWSSSASFYIILSFGFLVYILWSVLFDTLLREWDKRKISANIKKIIKHLNKDIKTLEAKVTPVIEIKEQIKNYREDISTVMHGNLKKYIDQFSSGWISFLVPANMKAVKERCINLKKDFEEKYQIKPGIVKVISRR
ncbi:MAG: hypothetical protein JEY96_03140 [Bacteroidales bacterium]|nr:hypothetical protein [Bacteroidales bacterium]